MGKGAVSQYESGGRQPSHRRWSRWMAFEVGIAVDSLHVNLGPIGVLLVLQPALPCSTREGERSQSGGSQVYLIQNIGEGCLSLSLAEAPQEHNTSPVDRTRRRYTRSTREARVSNLGIWCHTRIGRLSCACHPTSPHLWRGSDLPCAAVLKPFYPSHGSGQAIDVGGSSQPSRSIWSNVCTTRT